MSSASEKQQLFFPEGNRKRLPGGICTGCIAFRAQDRRPRCRALRLQQKDRVPGIRDDAQDAEGRAASAKIVADPEDQPVERAQQLAELELPLEVAVERGDLLLRDRQSCSDPRQDEIDDRRLRVHDAAGQTHYRLAVFVVSQQEHGPGQDCCAVGHDPRAAPGDRAGGIVVGIDAHAAGAEDHVDRLFPHLRDRRGDLLQPVADGQMLCHRDAVGLQLLCEDRRARHVPQRSVGGISPGGRAGSADGEDDLVGARLSEKMKKHALRLQRVFLVWSAPAAREHSECMIERRDDSAEIFARCLFRARDVQHERMPPGSGDCTGKHRPRRRLQSLDPHGDGDGADLAVEHGKRRLRRHVARREPGAPRS